ncbi:MAG: PEP-CTERM sorting domain-containing protein [Kiritimatiellia bacterium]
MRFTKFLLLSVAMLTFTALQADVIGYWRFENDSTVGEATTGPDLSATGTVTSNAIPGSGAGSDFFDPVPQTSSANNRMADFGARAGHLGVGTGTTGLNATTFTVEALFNAGAGDSSYNNYLVSSWDDGGNDRSWAIGLGRSSGSPPSGVTNNELFLLWSGGGSSTNVIPTGLDITRGEDYYLGMSFDQSSTTWTYHLKNLTLDSSLTTGTLAGSTLYDPGAAGLFQVGKISSDTGGNNRWDGLIDEVRFSNEVLPSGQLLVAIPEPGTLALLGISLAALALTARRNRRN